MVEWARGASEQTFDQSAANGMKEPLAALWQGCEVFDAKFFYSVQNQSV